MSSSRMHESGIVLLIMTAVVLVCIAGRLAAMNLSKPADIKRAVFTVAGGVFAVILADFMSSKDLLFVSLALKGSGLFIALIGAADLAAARNRQ